MVPQQYALPVICAAHECSPPVVKDATVNRTSKGAVLAESRRAAPSRSVKPSSRHAESVSAQRRRGLGTGIANTPVNGAGYDAELSGAATVATADRGPARGGSRC